jgi:hypothetical protein
MRKYNLILLIILFIKFSALGCSCGDSDIFNSYESAINIFTGKILSENIEELYDTLFVDQTNFEIIQTGDWQYDIQVLDVYKSEINANEIIKINTDRYSSCSYSLDVGSDYLIFTYKWNGKLYTGFCTRTAKIDSNFAKKDLVQLNKFKTNLNSDRYLQGTYISEDNTTIIKFSGNGRLIYQCEEDGETKKGKGDYIFKKGRLKVDFNQNMVDRTQVNHMLYEEGYDSIVFIIRIMDIDKNPTIDDFEISLLKVDGTEIYHADIKGNISRFAIASGIELLGMIFSKPGYPIHFENIPNWGKDYHELTLKWDQIFINLKDHKKNFKVSYKNDQLVLDGVKFILNSYY